MRSGEHLPIPRRLHQLAHLVGEVVREVLGIGRTDNPHAGTAPQQPGRQANARDEALHRARRHGDNQAPMVAGNCAHQVMGDGLDMPVAQVWLVPQLAEGTSHEDSQILPGELNDGLPEAARIKVSHRRRPLLRPCQSGRSCRGDGRWSPDRRRPLPLRPPRPALEVRAAGRAR